MTSKMEIPPCAKGNREGGRIGNNLYCVYEGNFFYEAIAGFLGLVVIMLAFGSEGCWFDPCLGLDTFLGFFHSKLLFLHQKCIFKLINISKLKEML